MDKRLRHTLQPSNVSRNCLNGYSRVLGKDLIKMERDHLKTSRTWSQLAVTAVPMEKLTMYPCFCDFFNQEILLQWIL
jgi:hypothetical protein